MNKPSGQRLHFLHLREMLRCSANTVVQLAASTRCRSEGEGSPSTLGRWHALLGFPQIPLRRAMNQNRRPGQGESQGPGPLPWKSPLPSSRMSPENSGSVQEEADNLPSCPRGTGWRTRSEGHPRTLGKTRAIKVMGVTGCRR